MNKNRKGLQSLFLMATILATVPALAATDNNMKKGKTQHAVPPAQYPNQEGQKNFFIGAAYTYWAPYQEGMNLAVGGDSTSVQGNIISARMNAQSGFKVFASSNCFHDGWVASACYTWFYNPASLRPNTLIDGPTYVPTFNADTISYSAMESDFTNQFNRIDVQVDRSFFAGHYLAFRPRLGLLAAWEKQHLNYNGDISGGENNAQDRFSMVQSWWGIGPYSGGEATYYFSSDWGLYISSGIAMLLSYHDVDNNNFRLETSFTAVNNSVDHFPNVEPMMEVGLGVRWEGNWTNWGLKIDLGWELQTYFNHNGFLGYYSPVGVYGNYSMQGLTLAAEVCF